MSKNSDYIVVFDSGVGGISVLRQLRKVLPKERYLYFGDSANAPYGVRSEEQIRELTLAAAEKLMKRGVKAFVIACNTATAAALEALRAAYPQTIIVGIEPALAMAAEQFPGGHIGVLATPATLASERFARNKAKHDPLCRITPVPAPGLADMVEAEKFDSPEADALLQALFAPYEGSLDAVVLGCTHYPFAEKALRRVLGPQVALIDGACVTAGQTRSALEQQGLLYDGPQELIVENSLPGERMIALSHRLITG